ncbi:hypothetical protein COY96_02785 [Candidatus Wolfebacteria bacterium CG_4_10_14_0_8_um_filter_37_11]|uniref:DOD-type homing endonuclease domain-containing protein n=3 Tax=Candidatus Wolfeibacteriota TaxID=1752735 RepID=A0A2M7Q7X2_9BACT|nr:MAG: hypothetical protein COY96_02785 [Candidatus Wolfebacteria bacterium CG_4_10_14_0_8_um_filter_37_11]PJA41682.1 MAG: hypothetical protein CO177_01065 [Candidatus Wolfebacteria bacterium CG_4_9_14_3_um_filter_37_9]
MRFIADFHIHSKYSRATSKEMILENIDSFADDKGILVMGTGDFTHPQWFNEIKTKLEPAEPGLFKLKKEYKRETLKGTFSETRFILTVEISSIYSKEGKVRRIHNLIFIPSMESAENLRNELIKMGCNLNSDGRPIIGLDSEKLAEIVFNINLEAVIIPAHAWTPWFSIFGSMSGFDSIEECFGKYTDKIFAIETGLSCYDKKTELLTENGWKKFTEVSYKDKVCTLNSKTGKIEFQKPTKIHNYSYKGKMYRLKTKRVDLLVTPNHNLLVSGCDFRKLPEFSLKTAEESFGKSKRFKKDGNWIGKKSKYFTLPAVNIKHGSRYYSGLRIKKEKKLPIKPWLKFFGFWIAEGWTTEGKNGDYNVCIANKNDELLSEMKEILENFGYTVYWDKKINNIVRVRNYQLFNYLKQFGKSSDKFIPLEIKSLSKELLEIFFEYYIKGDGHRYGRNKKGLSATTISIKLRDDLQDLALRLGMSAYYKLGYKKGTPILSLPKAKAMGYRQSADSWIIYFIRKNLHTILPSIIKKYKYTESWVDFNNKVYCVTIPNHVVYIRRNGIPVWCGNSDPAMNRRLSKLDNIALISNSDSHSLRKIGREANIFNTELSYNGIINVIKSGGPRFVSTIEFFPEEGKYHYDGHRACEICLSPEKTKKLKNICPKCGEKLTIGVMNRVDELADREIGKDFVPYRNLIPLGEIIAEAFDVGENTKQVKKEYEKLIKTFGNELKILMEISESELKSVADPRVAESIKRVREGKVKIRPGYDGEYGEIKIFTDEEREKLKNQGSLV